jgi:hypothetical protein
MLDRLELPRLDAARDPPPAPENALSREPP